MDITSPPQDGRWAVHADIATLRERFNLSASTLQVLHALLSFLPKGTFGRSAMVVFPSNESLCSRSGEMNERTLRRHLQRLIEAGLISRHASANGKRFCARALDGKIISAFGFDLSLLASRASAIAADAMAEREKQLQLKALRARLAADLNLIENDAFTEFARKALRRKLDLNTMLQLEKDIQTHLPQDLSATDSQNDRHIDSHNTDYIEEDVQDEFKKQLSTLNFQLCKTVYAPTLELLANSPKTWAEMIQASSKIEQWIAVETSQLERVQSLWGKLGRSLIALTLANKVSDIKNPKAYLEKILSQPNKLNFLKLLRFAQSKFTAVNTAKA